MLGFTDIVQLLLNRGANRLDEAMLQAATTGRTGIVKILLDAGADVHARQDEALRYAAEMGHLDTVQLLLQSGAAVHAQDTEMEAVARAVAGQHVAVATALRQHMMRLAEHQGAQVQHPCQSTGQSSG
eukprot:jgi/Chrzof1/6458/Cz18g11190.t1